MKKMAGLLGVVLLLALPTAALALKFEMFGNRPFTKQADWAAGVVEIVNASGRVYAVEGGMTSYTFFFRGNTKELNETLKAFGAVKAEDRRLILLPGSGKTESFERKPIDFDWQLHVPSGRYKAVTKHKHAALTVYIPGTKPRPRDRKPIDKLLADLNSDTFKVRDAAKVELEKLGNDAKPFLREALKAELPEEARRRIEGVLARLRDLDLSDLEIPKGITIITADDLLADSFLNLKDADPTVFGRPTPELVSSLVLYSDQVLPALNEMLGKKHGSYLRCFSAGWLGQLGTQAKLTIPQLKQGLDDPDPNVGKVFQVALTQIESAKNRPELDERVQKNLAIFREIRDFKYANAGSK